MIDKLSNNKIRIKELYPENSEAWRSEVLRIKNWCKDSNIMYEIEYEEEASHRDGDLNGAIFKYRECIIKFSEEQFLYFTLKYGDIFE